MVHIFVKHICFFAVLLFLTPCLAGKLTVYLYPAPLGIDWSSPGRLAWSAAANELVQDNGLVAIHSIGHANFDLHCADTRIVTGQTSADSGMMSKIFEGGYGLGMLLTNYKGRWETKKEIEADLPTRYSRGSIAFMEFKIRPSTCTRVAEYLRQYKQLKYDQIYGGLQSRARYREGAGCIDFTQSVMEIAGVFAPEFRSYWAHRVNIPYSVIGGPLTGNHIPVWDVLFGPKGWSWGQSAKDSYTLKFWDPFYAYHWIRYAHQGPVRLSGMTYKPARRGRALGIQVDATRIPTPQDPFFLKRP